MFKFIITAEKKSDLIGLLVDTAKVDVQKVKWNVNSITRSNDDADCEDEWDLCDLVDAGKFHEVDNAIMGGDVPVGGLVVVCDTDTNPSWGFVCGNGNSWYKVFLSPEITKAILSIVHPHARYFVIGCKRAHAFENKTDCGMWLEEGFNACEGSEQRRYASMMNQLDAGETFLDYDA